VNGEGDVENLAVLMVGMAREAEEGLSSALGQHQVIRSAGDAAAARNLLHAARPVVAIVRLDGTRPAEALELVRELSAKEIEVVTVGAQKDPEIILAAMRAGAREYLTDRELEPLERIVQHLLVTAGSLRFGRITAILPAKGGMGATTLATNLAGALHRQDKRVCLVDLDLELGDVLSFLDVRGSYSLADVAANTRRLDRNLLDQSLPRHASGVWVLSQAEKVDEGEGLDPEKVATVLRYLRPQYDHLILDGVHGFGDIVLAALDLADRIVLVVTQEVPAVRNAQRCAEILARLGYGPDRIMLVVNRFQRGSTITPQVIAETVKLPVSATVGNDFPSLSRAVNRGVLLWDEAPRSVVAKDVEALAVLMAPRAVEARRPSMLKRLFAPKGVVHGTD
jgi:pilus assembly protein CpaE